MRIPMMLRSLVTAVCMLVLLCAASQAAPMKADKILVLKGKRQLQLLRADRVLKTYRISLGRNPVGHKVRKGDYRTPEGKYIIDGRNPNSRYHRALHISYPDRNDIVQARRRGVNPGGKIMIHGLPNGHGPRWREKQYTDWTAGCIAVSDQAIREIWRAVPDGTLIEIRP